MSKYIFFIPARTGSKGVPNKNFKRLYSKPLVDITLDFASGLNWKDKLVVLSTDNEEYEEKCKSLNISFDLRSLELSMDTSKIRDVVLDFLTRKVIGNSNLFNTWLILLEPTTPLRSEDSLSALFNEINSSSSNSFVSVIRDNSIFWSYNGADLTRDYSNSSQRQERSPKFKEVGVFYACTVDCFMNFGFITDQTKTIEVPKLESLDINDHEDWFIVESVIKNKDL